MINFNELRDGNFVMPTSSFFNDAYRFIPQVVDLDLRYYPTEGSTESAYDYIEITPEILAKTNLIKSGENEYKIEMYNGGYILFKFINYKLYQVTSKFHVRTGIEIKHLHELQNRIFSFTGQELEINF